MPTLDDVLPLLHAGNFSAAIPMLEKLTRVQPPDAEVFYNLGLALSETQQFPEAVIALKRSAELDPRNHQVWIAIGVAYARLDRHADAKAALQEALFHKPSDGLALKNLAAELMELGEFEDAADTARLAMATLPPNPQALWAVAEAVRLWGQDPRAASKRESLLSEATDAYKLFLKRYPDSPMRERAEVALTRMAAAQLRENAINGFRPDVFEYIVDALKLFDIIGPEARNRVILEAAQIGAGGVNINDPSVRYKLTTLDGVVREGRDFSALNVVSIMYAGMQLVNPNIDSGADFSVEYQAARKHLGLG